MRNFIRTSHEQRRRSSAAASAEQLAYLTALSEQRQNQGAPLTNVDGVKMAAADIRRSSMGGDPAGVIAAAAAGAGSKPLLGAGGGDRRRGSLTGVGAVPGVGAAGAGGVLGVTGVQASPRRRWNCDKAHHRSPLSEIDALNMEIKQSSVLAIVLIVCAVCATVVILAYTLKAYL